MAKPGFYLDESVHVAVASGLVRRGINAISAKDAGNLGLSDKEQINYAAKNDLVIVTHDADFLSSARECEHKGSYLFTRRNIQSGTWLEI